jgi:RNA polymerase sigma-70 factor (ECF subfamily)
VDVWRYVARLLGSDAGAVADVVQETFLAAARSAQTFDADRGSLHAWLLGIAHHEVNACWRQASRTARLRQLIEEGAAEVRHLLDDAGDVCRLGKQNDVADLVRAALAEMSADYSELLIAKYLDECSLIELAEKGLTTVEAIKSKLSRARSEFRGKFERLVKSEETTSNIQRLQRNDDKAASL